MNPLTHNKKRNNKEKNTNKILNKLLPYNNKNYKKNLYIYLYISRARSETGELTEWTPVFRVIKGYYIFMLLM